MIFSELYSTYYHTVAAILAEALTHPVSKKELKAIIRKHAFEESLVTISEALQKEQWPLLYPDGTTPIKKKPSMPLSTLEKRWLKAVAEDPRIGLFGDVAFDLPQVEPLFHPSDVIFFDQYADGDAYTEETYGANFRCILKAIKEKQLLEINYSTGKGRFVQGVVLPVRLEYSEKDDKFRLSALEKDRACTINLGRILHCEPHEGSMDSEFVFRKPEQRSFTFEVTEERNTLERALLHFAHFQKRAEKVGEQKYSVTIFYEKEDETELVIRVLAFGPMIRVTGPDSFLACIRQRLKNQKSCEH